MAVEVNMKIQNLAPHAALTLDTSGVTHLRHRSGWGKSSIIHALCALVDGRDGRGLTVDAGHAVDAMAPIVVTFDAPHAVLAWSKKGTPKRQFRLPGGTDKHTVTTATEWAEVLRADPKVLRLIASPTEWEGLANGAGGGRPLRDLLDLALPGESAAEWLASRIPAGAPTTEKAATDARREANRALATAQGSQAEAERAVTDLANAPQEPGEDEAEAMDTLDRWDARRRNAAGAAAAHGAAVEAHRIASERWQEWCRRAPSAPRGERPMVAPGPAPSEPVSPVFGAPLSVEPPSRGALDAAERGLAMLRASEPKPPVMPSVPDAPACAGLTGCTLVAGRIALLEQARAMNDLHHAAVYQWEEQIAEGEDELAQLAEAYREARYQAAHAQEADKADRAKTQREHEERRGVWARAMERHRADVEAWQAWRTYDAAVEARGAEPPQPGLSPVPPVGVGEEPSEVQDARAVVSAWQAWRARGAAHFEARVKAEARALQAAARVEIAQAEAGAAEEVLRLVRSAPGEALRAKLATLGDLGRVSIEVPEEGDAICLRWDGRPWEMASTGERVALSAILRHAVRRATGLSWWPIVVDDAQSCVGIDYPAEAPCVVLWTVAS